MSDSPLNRAVAKLEAANLADDEIDSLAKAIALTLAAGDDEVEGFVDKSSPFQQGFSLNFEEFEVRLREQLRSPRDVWVVMEAGYIDASSVT